jgi:asparagine synthase (glutamine-hydrolysing)
MCGLAGALVFNTTSFELNEKFLISMRDAMKHRGPDGEGLWIAENRKIGLVHRRLSILDLTINANQPLTNQDKSLWLVFNGEIYNHQAIRLELSRLGKYYWKTDHSDSEVILHAFEEWGIDCLEKFRGMFAIALWDVRKRELWLIRDRLGIKPMYYSIHHGRLVFASEIKALLQDPDQIREMNEESAYHYLTFLSAPSPHTMFKGIRKIPPGSWLCIQDDGRIQEKKYWDLWEAVHPLSSCSEDEIEEQLMHQLQESIQLHGVSDVPVGVFLSGGIDSSINALLFSQVQKNSIQTFSMGYDQNYPSAPNELPYAHMVAQLIHSRHHEKHLHPSDLTGFFQKMIWHLDEPNADPACIPTYFTSQLARINHLSVCQVGEGADELFCGYDRWKKIIQLDALNHWKIPGIWKHLSLFSLQLMGQSESKAFEYLKRGVQGLPLSWNGAEALTENRKRRFLSKTWLSKRKGFSSFEIIHPFWKHFQEQALEKSYLNWLSYLDLNFRLPDVLLMRVDKMTMSTSLEARVPFLDHRLVEFAMSIPVAIKLKHGQLKYLLKKSFQKQLPPEILHRPKQGFSVPIREWFPYLASKETVQEVKTFCQAADFFNWPEVSRIFIPGNEREIWYFKVLAGWWNQYIAHQGHEL